jgi:hypothetical protein
LLEKSAPDKLCFQVGFHHMNENGYYDGWSHFTLVVRPSFIDPCGTMLLKGRDRDQIKEYLYDVYNADLGQIIAWDWEDGKYAKPKE